MFFVGLAQIGPWISWAANQVQNSLLPMTSSGGFLFYCNFLTLPPLHTNFLHLANLNLQLALGRRTFSTSISNRFASRLFCHRHSSQRFGAHTKFHSRLSFTDSSLPIWGLYLLPLCISATSALELCSKIAACGLFKEITGEPRRHCI